MQMVGPLLGRESLHGSLFLSLPVAVQQNTLDLEVRVCLLLHVRVLRLSGTFRNSNITVCFPGSRYDRRLQVDILVSREGFCFILECHEGGGGGEGRASYLNIIVGFPA